MSVYFFAPSPDLSTREQSFATWENGFSDDQINDIIRIGNSLIPRDATLGGVKEGEDISGIRKSKTSWISLNNETSWLYDSLAYIARQINGQFFNYDLDGFVEDFQYTVYDGTGGHYAWHIDKGLTISASPRKLSMVLQLTDPAEYEGGDLEFYISPEPFKAKKQKGLMYIFPSWVLHRVTPVTSGVRRSLVVWVSGPKFK